MDPTLHALFVAVHQLAAVLGGRTPRRVPVSFYEDGDGAEPSARLPVPPLAWVVANPPAPPRGRGGHNPPGAGG